ncbi:DUF5686 family protein [Flavobacterium sp. I3-2]|uniref:DUF5686 family protein n=1 Tax=Flavobacterium sp. I3-2 TaxID=2748319 RepID=UPI0015ADB338|nr:DUF5686 family protein [Flavobacterium sp. I3-2]
MKPLKHALLLILFFLIPLSFYAQTKVGGIVKDNNNQPLAYVSVYFKNSSEGIITNELGKFYLESDSKFDTLVISYIGFADKFIPLKSATNLNLNIQLEEDNTLEEMKIYVGKTSKKDNPALDILRKIWANKRKNGLYKFDQYQYSKYEKVEFDMNSIDSAFMKKRIFNGMEFIFNHVDTSSITGKTYLPIFINEKASMIYGDNIKNKKKELVKGNKNSGFENNQHIISFINDLYVDYNIYNNYIRFYDKDFVSPLSTTGINVYNYVLADSTFIGNKWCYNIVFYPRRKGELTFKGDFWVNDTTWAIKKINLAVSKGVNINWVKDIYVEQEFEVFDDSVFLLTKDHMMTDFSISKKDESKGVYGKRTTYYKDHKFNVKRPDNFYTSEVNTYDESIMARDDSFWETYRFEPLSEEEMGIYEMLDALKENKRFNSYVNAVSILSSEYIQFGNFDYGPIFSSLGFNDVEGTRFRVGGRTYFGPNDYWRLEGFLAYGIKDDKFKYGISAKYMLDKRNRFMIYAGNRRDVEQIGASLSPIVDVLGRSFASSALFASGDNSKLSNINTSTAGLEIEPVKNLKFSTSLNYKTLKTASPTFSLDYLDLTTGTIEQQLKQSEINVSVDYTPKRKYIGYGVDRIDVNYDYARLFVNYSLGVKGMLNGDFDYKKIQVFYKHPFWVGGFGRLTPIVEAGKTFGTVPLGLMSVIPGNQSYFRIENAFSQLNYYEFVTDTYVTLHLEHNFEGRLFSRIPYLRDLNLREIIGFRGAYGTVSDENKAINASNINYVAPTDKIYYEYYVGVGNIFKLIRLDFTWRGNYLENPGAHKFGAKIGFGFQF